MKFDTFVYQALSDKENMMVLPVDFMLGEKKNVSKLNRLEKNKKVGEEYLTKKENVKIEMLPSQKEILLNKNAESHAQRQKMKTESLEKKVALFPTEIESKILKNLHEMNFYPCVNDIKNNSTISLRRKLNFYLYIYNKDPNGNLSTVRSRRIFKRQLDKLAFLCNSAIAKHEDEREEEILNLCAKMYYFYF